MQELLSTIRETPGVLSLAGQGVVLLCLVGLFAFMGPFGTYDTLGPLERTGYWTLALGVNWLVCGSATMLTLRSMDAASGWRRTAAVAGVSLLAAAPGTAVVFTAEALFRPDYLEAGRLSTIYPAVAVLMLAISGLVVTVGARRGSVAEATRKENAAATADRFLDRLPGKTGRDLICLKMADHYVEVFTTSGSTLLLMRFADAVSELDGADGLRVHRSHWVARRHVVGILRRNGRTFLRLTGDHEVPVSRGYLAEIREAGLA